jgi:Ser/Thr protein kinase RdoA (MazF antagonist)
VIHYDTKLNNILFDKNTHQGVCVIDLDTVMPGSILYDFGDLVRNAAVPAREDETDLSSVEVDLDLFQGLVRGYLKGVNGLLEDREIELMALAPRVIALTLGIRFLTDYINGDVYFVTQYPQHNLDRSRTQFKIVESLERRERAMDAIVRSQQLAN